MTFLPLLQAASNASDSPHSLLGMPDWHRMFASDTPLIEIFVRGSIMYLGLFLLLRLVLKREAGTVGITDMLVVVMIADAAQNGMAGDYMSITDGLFLVGTIVFWSFALDWLAYRSKFIRRFVSPPPLLLVRNGRIQHRNMRRELITEEDLMGILRQHGVEDVADVRQACMEGDGQISVIRRQKDDDGDDDAPRKRAF